MGSPNDVCIVLYLTVRLADAFDESARTAFDAAAAARGGAVRWRTSRRAQRTYGLVQLQDSDVAAAWPAPGATLFDRCIVALAVFPAMPEALPLLLDALGGTGRPAGIVSCDEVPGGVAIELDPARTAPLLVRKLVDLELARLRCGSVTESLSPLPDAIVAAIARDGLRAPEIAEDRILEALVEKAGLHA